MPVTKLVIPHECCEHLDQLDALLDVVHDIGGAYCTWGPCHRPTSVERVWVAVHNLPGHDKPLHMTGSTLNAAAWACMQREWPDPDDQCSDPI